MACPLCPGTMTWLTGSLSTSCPSSRAWQAFGMCGHSLRSTPPCTGALRYALCRKVPGYIAGGHGFHMRVLLCNKHSFWSVSLVSPQEGLRNCEGMLDERALCRMVDEAFSTFPAAFPCAMPAPPAEAEPMAPTTSNPGSSLTCCKGRVVLCTEAQYEGRRARVHDSKALKVPCSAVGETRSAPDHLTKWTWQLWM